MRLMTNNPVKRVGLEAYGLEIVENVPIEITPNEYNEYGLEIVENVPIEITPNEYNERYLKTKRDRMGHTLHFKK